MNKKAFARIAAPLLAVALSLGFSAPVAAQEAEVLAYINQARVEAGCKPLRQNNKLNRAAAYHAKQMAVHDYFGHQNADGSKFSIRFKKAGYNGRKMAENIQAGWSEPYDVAFQWLNSPSHARNIMNCAFTETGVAVYYQADDQPFGGHRAMQYYWVQTFGTPK